MTSTKVRRLRLVELERREVPSGFGLNPLCLPVNATISGHVTSLTAEGGTTDGVIQQGGFTGTTHLDVRFTDTQGDFLGTLTISSRVGTLTLRQQGNLNEATGAFSDAITVVSGTGLFTGATGSFIDHGTANLATGTFTDVPFQGTLCLGSSDDCTAIQTAITGHITSLTAAGGTTDGVIQQGVLRGTTHLDVHFTDAQGDYLGTLVITTRHGTLTLRDQGHLDETTGAFVDQLTVIGGTGRFAGATGTFADQGVANLATGTFTNVTFLGTLCYGDDHGHGYND